MTGPQVFALVWSVLALGLGYLGARHPDIPARMYVEQMSRTAVTKKLQETFAPRTWIIVSFRIGGIVFMLLGIGVGIAAAIGVLK
jgi:hypothetical protein